MPGPAESLGVTRGRRSAPQHHACGGSMGVIDGIVDLRQGLRTDTRSEIFIAHHQHRPKAPPGTYTMLVVVLINSLHIEGLAFDAF